MSGAFTLTLVRLKLAKQKRNTQKTHTHKTKNQTNKKAPSKAQNLILNFFHTEYCTVKALGHPKSSPG